MKWNNKKFKTADELTTFLNDKMDKLNIDFRKMHITEHANHSASFITLYYYGEPSKD